MKKISVVFLVVTLFMMFVSIAPVMASTSKEIEVTFVRAVPFTVKGEYWYTEGDTFHTRNAGTGFNNYSIIGTGISLNGNTSSTYIGNVNLKTMEGNQLYHSQIVFPDGTFEGTITMKGTFTILPDDYPVEKYRGLMRGVDVVFSGIWHGTDAYRGWILTLDYETVGGVTPSPLIGYLSIP